MAEILIAPKIDAAAWAEEKRKLETEFSKMESTHLNTVKEELTVRTKIKQILQDQISLQRTLNQEQASWLRRAQSQAAMMQNTVQRGYYSSRYPSTFANVASNMAGSAAGAAVGKGEGNAIAKFIGNAAGGVIGGFGAARFLGKLVNIGNGKIPLQNVLSKEKNNVLNKFIEQLEKNVRPQSLLSQLGGNLEEIEGKGWGKSLFRGIGRTGNWIGKTGGKLIRGLMGAGGLTKMLRLGGIGLGGYVGYKFGSNIYDAWKNNRSWGDSSYDTISEMGGQRLLDWWGGDTDPYAKNAEELQYKLDLKQKNKEVQQKKLHSRYTALSDDYQRIHKNISGMEESLGKTNFSNLHQMGMMTQAAASVNRPTYDKDLSVQVGLLTKIEKKLEEIKLQLKP